MHRDVLRHADYVRYSGENTVEVLAMEEMPLALERKDRNVATAGAKDLHGRPVEHLVEFPGLTVEALLALSNSPAIGYMRGGRIPYTAIVDPHDLEEREGIEGRRTAKELIAAIEPHRKALLERHGKGMARKAWDSMILRRAEIERLLGEGRIRSAMEAYRLLLRETAGSGEIAERKAKISLELILDDAAEALDALEAALEGGKAADARAPLRELAAALQGTALAERAAALLARAG
ncbi:MAG: hypothetical protein ACT4PV_15305 [Planctomycetaceae bacterium]